MFKHEPDNRRLLKAADAGLAAAEVMRATDNVAIAADRKPFQGTANNVQPESSAEAQPSMWGGVFAMTLCTFALVASEFMPVSLLTPVAVDLKISQGMAGQAISVSGAFAVLTSLSISALADKMSRKTLLLWMTGLMFLSGPVIALAPNYATYMAGRVLIGVAIGGFWSMSAAAALRLVPAPQVPRALAIFNGGNALATVVAAPLGSYLGAVIGWRGAFFCLAPVAMLAFLWQWISLPRMAPEERAAGSGNVFTLLSNPLVALGMAAVGVFFMGQFALFTYLRPFLETVTGVAVSTLSFVLLTIGVAGFIGTVLIGACLKRSFYGTLIAIPLLMAMIALGLIVLGSSLAAVVVLLGVWGLIATAAPVGWWTWVARTIPENAEGGGGLMVAVVQLAIGLGSTVGGLLFDICGYRSTFMASAGLLMISAFLAFLASRAALGAARSAAWSSEARDTS
jgi:predicted MFS family arabinose efflux permease